MSLSSSHVVPTLKMEGWKLKIFISKQTIPLPPAFQPTSSCLACLGVSWPQLLLWVLTKHVSYLIALKTLAEHTPWNKAKIKLNPIQIKKKEKTNNHPNYWYRERKRSSQQSVTNGIDRARLFLANVFPKGFSMSRSPGLTRPPSSRRHRRQRLPWCGLRRGRCRAARSARSRR